MIPAAARGQLLRARAVLLLPTLLTVLHAGPGALPPAEAVCPSKVTPRGANPPPGSGVPLLPPTGSPGLPGTLPPRTPGDGPAPRAPDALDELSWEPWWALNRDALLAPVRRQAPAEPGAYARSLPPALNPALEVLLEALRDPDERVREAAAGALAVIPGAYRAGEVRALLRETVRRGRPYERDLAGLALARRGDAEAAPGLRRILANPREERVSRGFAAMGLVLLDDAEGLEAVAAAAADLDEPEVAGVALLALGAAHDLRHLPVLMTAADRRTGAAARLRRVRADALAALGKLGAPSTLPFLTGLLADRERSIARSAALALGGFAHEPSAVRALSEQGLGADDAFVRAFAAVSLGRVGEAQAVPALAAHTRDDASTAVPPFALLGLGLLGSQTGVPFLREPLLQQPPYGRYAAAALAAGLLRAKTYAPLLEPGLAEARTAGVPMGSALGLALLGDSAFLPALGARLWLDGRSLRPGFADALARLEPRLGALRLALELERTTRSGARQALVEALGLCAGPPDAPRLVSAWRAAPAGDTALRTRVVTALARLLADHEPSFAARLRAHTYYLQDNIVLDHLASLP